MAGEVEVDAGTDFEVPVICYPGCIVQWRFRGGDMAFGMYYTYTTSDAAAVVVVVHALTRVDDALGETCGEYRVPAGGGGERTLVLQFSNAFSYLRGKTLHYAVELEEPLGLLSGPFVPTPRPGVIFVASKTTKSEAVCARLATEHGFLHLKADTGGVVDGMWQAIRSSSRKFVLIETAAEAVPMLLQAWRQRVGSKADVLGVVVCIGGDGEVEDGVVRVQVKEDDEEDDVYVRVRDALPVPKPLPGKRDFFCLPPGQELPQQQDAPITTTDTVVVVRWDCAPSQIASQLLQRKDHVAVLVLEYHVDEDGEEEADYTRLDHILEACDSLHRQGQFFKLGVKRFPAWLLVHSYHVCSSRGWLKPSLCIDKYHVLRRDRAERELLPALRTLGSVSFHPEIDDQEEEEDNEAKAEAVCARFGLSLLEANVCWLFHHSRLRVEDVVESGGLVKRVMSLPLSLGVQLAQLAQ